MTYTCIGKMNGSKPLFYDQEPEFGVVPLPDDIVVVGGLIRRMVEKNFRTLGTVRDFRQYFTTKQVKEWTT